MTWQDVADWIGKAAPFVGSLLGGKAGEKVGELISSALGVENKPDKVLEALKNNPDAILKVKQLESNERVRLEELRHQAETAEIQAGVAQIESVNRTMQAEAAAIAGQAWYQKAWRPANGFAVAIGSLLSILFVCYLFYTALTRPDLGMNVATVINTIPTLAFAIASILAVPGAAVGVAAWHRGKMQRIEAGELEKK